MTLREWIDKNRFTLRQAADYLGWTKPSGETKVSRLARGLYKPKLETALHIQKKTHGSVTLADLV